MPGRIGVVIIYQVLALVLAVTGAATTMSATATMNIVDFSTSGGAYFLVSGLLILTELVLIVRVSSLARRAYRCGQRDVALGWLTGLLAVVGIPFLMVLLVMARALLPL